MTRARRISGSALARLVIGYLLIAAVFTFAWLWSLYGPLTKSVTEQQQRNLRAVAQSASLLVSESSRTPTQVAEQLVARTDLRLTIIAADGTVIADSDYDPAQMENHANRPEVAAALDGVVGSARRTSRTEGNAQLYIAVPSQLGGQRIAVRVSQPVAQISQIAANARQVGLLLLACALAAAGVIGWIITRTIARPVQALGESAERMAAGDLSVPVPDVPTDLRPLATALVDLRQQVKSRIDALEAEQATLRTTLDGLADAVLVLEEGRIILANRRADDLLRTPEGGWEGADLRTALPGALGAAVETHLGTDSPVALDLEPEPTGRTLRLMVAPLGELTASDRRVVIIADITQSTLLDSVRQNFVANASHELKTPVAGIKLLAESAAQAASDGDDEQAVIFARQIAEEVTRLQRLVGDLLDLSRLESLPSPGVLTEVRQALDNAVLSHRPAAARKSLALDLDLSAIAAEDVYARTDPTDFAIALDNLLDNAINYTDAGGVSVTVAADDSVVTITVSDSGRGIAPEHLPRVFERFYRADAGRSRESGGTGLGLALVKHVAERSGGTVDVESAPGEGSRFRLTLPRAV